MLQASRASLFRLAPPYSSLEILGPARGRGAQVRGVEEGSFLVWNMAFDEPTRAVFHEVARRPYGVSLVVILPPADSWRRSVRDAFELIVETRPARILPHHRVSAPGELVDLMREGPGSIPAEVLDYLAWRGLWIDRDTRQVLSKIGELSDEVTTMAAVARGLYLSRRSLGRRFQARGLPTPSQWLKVFRILRSCVLLQRTGLTLHDVARNLHYPDAFTLSNQMYRMAGVRSERIRSHVGWEWIFEAWIRREEAKGSFQAARTADARSAPSGGTEVGS